MQFNLFVTRATIFFSVITAMNIAFMIMYVRYLGQIEEGKIQLENREQRMLWQVLPFLIFATDAVFFISLVYFDQRFAGVTVLAICIIAPPFIRALFWMRRPTQWLSYLSIFTAIFSGMLGMALFIVLSYFVHLFLFTGSAI